MDSSHRAASDVLRLFRERPAEFRREPVKIALWQHGGGPGRGFTSDQLEIELQPDGSVSAAFVRTRFDATYAPPFLAERFTGPVTKAQAEDVLRLALAGPLFERDHPTERDPQIGGVMKEDWDASRGSARLHKTFFQEPFPVDYAAVRDACRKLMTELAQHGKREVLHRKREGQ